MKHSWILALAMAVSACSPQIYSMYLDVRHPSKSGLTLSGKNISIVYMDGYTQVDSLFDRQVASSMARQLEEDYFNGQEKVGIYRIPSADTVTLEKMHSLVMETEGDVVFLLRSKLGEPTLESNRPVSGASSPDSAFVCPAVVPVKTQLDVYDSMGEDKVHHFQGSAVLRARVFNNGILTDDGLKSLSLRSMGAEADKVGERVSTRFLSNWVTESFSFYYVDPSSSDIWVEALVKVLDGELTDAVDKWGLLVKSGSAQKRACACYNIAQAFYLMGDYSLSSRWLDEAEKLENISLAPGLRKRLAAHLEK
ncbi:MAG: hypothetical protein IJ714_02335 [Bacteroidales bacterium]|nr:hypothetical protein [Bacteroidales bacterium]